MFKFNALVCQASVFHLDVPASSWAGHTTAHQPAATWTNGTSQHFYEKVPVQNVPAGNLVPQFTLQYKKAKPSVIMHA
jgi:hypothetical protein